MNATTKQTPDNTYVVINEQGHVTLTETSQLQLFRRCNALNIKLHDPTSQIGRAILEQHDLQSK